MFSLWRMSMALKISSFKDGVAKIRFRKDKIDHTPQHDPKNPANNLNNRFSLN